MALDEIQILYKCYGILEDAKEDAREHPEEYETILNSTMGSIKEKKLGATFIPRFYKYFPDLQLKALNCLMDLCEEYDTHIRRLAIQALPSLCRDSKDHLNKIADVLTQLLPSENDVELDIVRKALNEVIELDPKEAILGIFSQINAGDDEAREQAVNFLKESVLGMIPKVFDGNPEASETLVEEIHKAMHDVTAEEFRVFISLLSKLKTFELKHDELVDLIAEQADLKSEVNDVEAVDKYITCTRVAIPFFKKGANAEQFFLFLVGKIFPVIEVICTGEDSGDIKWDLYKILAEICTQKISDEALHSSLKEIFDRLLHYMPLPEVNEEGTTDASEESTETQIQFSHVECLMYSFHKVARKYPEFLTAADAAERLRDFKLRLQHVGQRCQMYIKQIKMALNQKSGKDEEVKVKVIALKTTSNIHTLIKDLFHSPPSYNSAVNLSWVTTKTSVPTTSEKKDTVPTDNVLAEKRKRAGITPITFNASPQPKRASNVRQQMEYYLPPGRRADSSNGERKGTPMSGRYYNTRGNWRGFRGRGGRWRSRGGNRGWNF